MEPLEALMEPLEVVVEDVTDPIPAMRHIYETVRDRYDQVILAQQGIDSQVDDLRRNLDAEIAKRTDEWNELEEMRAELARGMRFLADTLEELRTATDEEVK